MKLLTSNPYKFNPSLVTERVLWVHRTTGPDEFGRIDGDRFLLSAGSSVELMYRSTSGRGRGRATRYLVRCFAIDRGQGWAWVDPSDVAPSSTAFEQWQADAKNWAREV